MQTDQDFKPNVIQQAVKLVALGISYSRVGRRFGVPHYRVRFWVKRYEGLSVEEIAKGIIRHRPGRPRTKKDV
jgi:transposase